MLNKKDVIHMYVNIQFNRYISIFCANQRINLSNGLLSLILTCTKFLYIRFCKCHVILNWFNSNIYFWEVIHISKVKWTWWLAKNKRVISQWIGNINGFSVQIIPTYLFITEPLFFTTKCSSKTSYLAKYGLPI